MIIPTVSRRLLPEKNETIAESMTAKSRILMMGLSKFFRYCFQSGSRSGGVITFAPYFFRLSSAAGDARPSTPAYPLISSSVSMYMKSLCGDATHPRM